MGLSIPSRSFVPWRLRGEKFATKTPRHKGTRRNVLLEIIEPDNKFDLQLQTLQ